MAPRAVQLVLLIATIGLWSVEATRVRAEDDPAALAAALKDTTATLAAISAGTT